jgi:hypothetical protein
VIKINYCYGFKKERSIQHTIKWRPANWTCVGTAEGKTEGKREETERRGRRCRQLISGVQETKGCWNLKREALDRTLWRTHFGRGCGLVVRQTAELINE